MVFIDIIPFFHFVVALMMFGLLFYVYDPVIIYLQELFPASGIYAEAMLFMWGALALINLFASGIRLVMKLQQR